MPEHEFEIYLSAVSRLLRLNPEQKSAIADELRDHLEERLKELTGSGMDRDQAVRRALDEFGDASGLAVEFSRVMQSRMRRVVMRTAAVTIVLLIAANVLIHTFFPAGADREEGFNALLGHMAAEPLLASDETEKVKDAAPAAPSQIELEPLMPVELQTRVAPMTFIDSPLSDSVALLSESYGIPIVIDEMALEDDGLTSDHPINLTIQPLPDRQWNKLNQEARQKYVDSHPEWQVTLAQVLDRMLHPEELEWRIEDNVVVVTTSDYAAIAMLNRSLPVRDLLATGMTKQSLIDTLMFMTDGTWEETDGEGGTMQLVGTILNVKQTFQMQRQIEQLLPILRRQDSDPCAVMHPVDYWRIREKLEMKVGDVDFVDTPLSDVIDFLSELTLLDFHIDEEGLNEYGLSTDEPLNLKMGDRPLRTVLKFLFKPHGLGLMIEDGRPTITATDVAKANLHTIIYDIRGMDAPSRLTRLKTALMGTTTGNWVDMDGDGGVLLTPGGGRLLIHQDLTTQMEIGRVLTEHRRFLKALGDDEPPPEKPQLETRFYRVPDQTAEDLLDILQEFVAPDSWKIDPAAGQQVTIRKVAVGPKIITLPGRKVEAPASKVDRKKADGAAKNDGGGKAEQTQLLAAFQGNGRASDAANNGNPPNNGVVVVPEAVLIIRQTPKVHTQIESFLRTMGLDVRGELLQMRNGRMGGGGFGGGFF